MKKAIAIVMLAISFSAAASCPIGMPYRCVPAGNKMMCGCGM